MAFSECKAQCALLSLLMAATAITAAPRAQAADKPQSIWEQEKLTGDWAGARIALKDRGVDITLKYIGETFDMLSGGLQKQPSYEGRAEFSLDADLQKLIGWTGGTTHVTVFNIHNSGHNVAARVGSIADPSNIDAVPTTRLFTAWFEQSFGTSFSVRIGQLAGDDEFITSETAGGLLNGTFGWAGISGRQHDQWRPGLSAGDAGRAREGQCRPTSLLCWRRCFPAIRPGPNCNDDPQRCNAHGTNFSFYGGVAVDGRGAIRHQCNASACPASTSSAAGTRRPISPTSISVSNRPARCSRLPIRQCRIRCFAAAIGAFMASPIRWSGVVWRAA